MTKFLLLMMAAQVATGAVQAPAVPAVRKPQSEKLICVDAQQLGTRLGNRRICRTKAEWEQERQSVRADTENAQRTNIHE